MLILAGYITLRKRNGELAASSNSFSLAGLDQFQRLQKKFRGLTDGLTLVAIAAGRVAEVAASRAARSIKRFFKG